MPDSRSGRISDIRLYMHNNRSWVYDSNFEQSNSSQSQMKVLPLYPGTRSGVCARAQHFRLGLRKLFSIGPTSLEEHMSGFWEISCWKLSICGLLRSKKIYQNIAPAWSGLAGLPGWLRNRQFYNRLTISASSCSSSLCIVDQACFLGEGCANDGDERCRSDLCCHCGTGDEDVLSAGPLTCSSDDLAVMERGRSGALRGDRTTSDVIRSGRGSRANLLSSTREASNTSSGIWPGSIVLWLAELLFVAMPESVQKQERKISARQKVGTAKVHNRKITERINMHREPLSYHFSWSSSSG